MYLSIAVGMNTDTQGLWLPSLGVASPLPQVMMGRGRAEGAQSFWMSRTEGGLLLRHSWVLLTPPGTVYSYSLSLGSS